MAYLMPKDFIKIVLIDELGDMINSKPYLSFTLMAIGVEFLGKCMDVQQSDWNLGGSETNFRRAINGLNSLKIYRDPILLKYKLWDSFRNGFAHSFVPKKTLSLSSKNEMVHMNEYLDNGIEKINLRCEDFYDHFKSACEEVIKTPFIDRRGVINKMNRPLLAVP